MPIPIRDFYVRAYFVREKLVAPLKHNSGLCYFNSLKLLTFEFEKIYNWGKTIDNLASSAKDCLMATLMPD